MIAFIVYKIIAGSLEFPLGIGYETCMTILAQEKKVCNHLELALSGPDMIMCLYVLDVKFFQYTCCLDQYPIMTYYASEEKKNPALFVLYLLLCFFGKWEHTLAN